VQTPGGSGAPAIIGGQGVRPPALALRMKSGFGPDVFRTWLTARSAFRGGRRDCIRMQRNPCRVCGHGNLLRRSNARSSRCI